MENKAASDTGPVMHLTEIDSIDSLKVFDTLVIPDEVFRELKKLSVPVPRFIKIVPLKDNSKDLVKIMTNQHDLDLGEGQSIALAFQEKADYFLTDDLEARSVAISMGIETHGSVGIILRAFREKMINEHIAIEKVRDIQRKSTLFITKDLIDEIIKAVEGFK